MGFCVRHSYHREVSEFHTQTKTIRSKAIAGISSRNHSALDCCLCGGAERTMLRSPHNHHHRNLNPLPPHHYSSSPASTCSDEDSDHSQPNDLSSKHSPYPHYGSGGGGGGGGYHSSHHSSQQSPYVATNECRVIEYRGARIAAFLSANKNPGEYLLCLPQAFELFLKHLVGGLHTVYTKLKRLDIVPIVCNVEQVRILRGLGAIQPGVNRCKLLSTKDFDVLFKDCTTASRPGRPPKRSPVAGMVSPVPTSLTSAAPAQPGGVPYLGFPPTKKPRYTDDPDFGSPSPDLKRPGSNNTNGNSSAATAAAMLAANGYSAAFPFLQHFANSSATNQQQQQLAAAAAALGLPGLPSGRFNNSSSPAPPSLPASGMGTHAGNHNSQNLNSGSSNNGRDGTVNCSSNGGPVPVEAAGDFNPTAILWLLSQQQHHHSAAAAAAALNLSGRAGHSGSSHHPLTNGIVSSGGTSPSVAADRAHGNAVGSGNNAVVQQNGSLTGNNTSNATNNNNNHNNTGSQANNHNSSKVHQLRNRAEAVDESTDDEVDDDESRSSHSDSQQNPVSSTGFNGLLRETGSTGNHHHQPTHQPASHHHPHPDSSPTHTPVPTPTQPTTGAGGPQPEQHCLETLLRNIEGLLAIAAHNAREQQRQLHLQKAELRGELAAQIDREREIRDQIEKQLNEEQKIRLLYQKRFRKERRCRRRLEQELQMGTAVHQRETGHAADSKQTAASPAVDREQPLAPVQPQQPQGQMSGGGGGSCGSTGRGSPDAGSPDTEQERPCSTEANAD